MNKLLFILTFLFSCKVVPCTKEIVVDVINKKVFPSIFDWTKRKEYIKKNQLISIDCKLYNQIEIGDILEPKDKDDLDFNIRDGLLNSPIEEIKYKVIKK